jgi:hypothetical protein
VGAFAILLEAPCGDEELPKKLKKAVRKKVSRAEKSLRKAARAAKKAKGKKAGKLQDKATKQLDDILRKSAQAVKARKANQRISENCERVIEGLVRDRQQVIGRLVF